MRAVVLIFIFLILASLFSALYYLIKDKGQSERTVKALTVRIILSITLFALLMLGFHFGWLPQRGL
ncbi:MAG TPA: twin transmembrane helix small protein [Sulfuriferula sp.]|nr:twin transmembrane helix small protein [Sulfuriferula sp.]